MLMIIGLLIGFGGIFCYPIIGRPLAVILGICGLYIMWKQIYIDELENELERRDLGYKPRRLKRRF